MNATVETTFKANSSKKSKESFSYKKYLRSFVSCS